MRGVRVTQDVQPGDLLMVTNPVAILDYNSNFMVRARSPPFPSAI